MHRFALREGWTTYLLVALLVFTATWSVQRADWADGLEILTIITLLGLVVGLALAVQRRVPAVVAHLVALVLGTVVVLYQMTGFLSENLGSRWDRLDYLWTRWELWFHAVSRGERADDLYLFILLMAALLWVVAYASVWFVLRSHWVWLSLLLPGIILLLNMGYSTRVPGALLVLYLFAAVLLLMRFNFAQRQIHWRRFGIPFPDSLTWRGFWVASYLAVAVIMFGWVLPVSAHSNRIVDAWDQVNGPWKQVEHTFNTWFASLRGPGGVGVGGYASFGNEFELGGPLRLSNEPVVLVKGSSSAPYLTAHTYDTFTGRGWESSATEGVQPLLEFGPMQKIPVPEAATQGRVETPYTVQVYQPRGAVVYSAGELSTFNVPTQVQVGWYTYRNQPLDVQSATEGSTPPDLWPLVEALQELEYPPPPPTPTPTPPVEEEPEATPEAGATPSPQPTPAPTPTPTAEERAFSRQMATIQQRQASLKQRGIETHFTEGPDRKVERLIFSGPLPVFADVEAIFAQGGVRSGDEYKIEALQSQATPDELRAASTDYPVEISSRYLQLPDDATPRTRELAEQLAQGQANPYDIAATIERYLRENYAYNEDVANPPANREVVDYFLFESRQGYCTYYASAMVEMLRMLDIPSRMAVGFYPAGFDSGAGGYLYRDLNAHAWPEVYFPGYGWIPFEPTAARSPIQRGAPATSTSTASGEAPINGLQDLPNRLEELNGELEGAGLGGGTGVIVTQQESRVGWVMRGVAAVIVLAVAGVAFLWLRGMRGMSPVTQFYSKAQRGARWGGLHPRAAMTPYEFAASIGKQIPGSRTHVEYLADLYVRETYGHKPASSTELHRAHVAWSRLRGLLVRFLLLGRWRARPIRDEEEE